MSQEKTMTDTDIHQISERLRDLGDRIHRKMTEFETQGAMHGAARQKAADLKIEHKRLDALAEAKKAGDASGEQHATLAAEVEALHLSFERWLSGIDKGF